MTPVVVIGSDPCGETVFVGLFETYDLARQAIENNTAPVGFSFQIYTPPLNGFEGDLSAMFAGQS